MTFFRRPIIREWLFPAGLTGALVVLLTAPAILTGQIPYFMDTVMQFYPARLAAAAALHRGEFPFWNPTYYCGAPLWANPQWGLGWPGLWPFLAIPRPGVYTAVMAAHLWLGALGMIAWARAERMGRGAALAAGAFYLLNGYTWAHWAFGSYFLAMWTGPWTMALLANLRSSVRSSGNLFLRLTVVLSLALVWAGLLLAGAPQVVWLFALWFGAAAAWDAVALVMGRAGARRSHGEEGGGRSQGEEGGGGSQGGEGRGWKPAAKYLGSLALAALLALGLAAPQLLPMLALQSDLTRADALPLGRVATGALSLADLARALLGGAGLPEDANTTLYFGAIGAALALTGLVRMARSRLRDVLALALFLLLALQALAPVFYHILPGYARFHDPRRALTVAMPLLCFFLAGGVAHLASVPDVRFRRAALMLALALVPLAAVEIFSHWQILRAPVMLPIVPALGWLPVPAPPAPLLFLIAFFFVIALYLGYLWVSPEFKTMPASKGRRLAMTLVLLGAMQLAVFALARIDAKFIRAADFYHESEAVRLIRETGARYFAYDPTQAYSYEYARPSAAARLLPNAGAVWGLRDFQGYDPAIPRAYREFLVSRGIGGGLYSQHFGLVQNPWALALAEAGVRWAVGDITAYYPDAPRTALLERATLSVPLPDGLPRRINTLAVSMAATPQSQQTARPWVIVQVEYGDGAPSRFVVAPPDSPAPSQGQGTSVVADVRDQGGFMRAVAEVPLDPAREVAAITLANQLAPGSMFDVRLRLDLADTGHWRRVETTDPFPFFESTLPLPPPGAEWSPFDTSRPPRGFALGLALFAVALTIWLTIIWHVLRSKRPDLSDLSDRSESPAP